MEAIVLSAGPGSLVRPGDDVVAAESQFRATLSWVINVEELPIDWQEFLRIKNFERPPYNSDEYIDHFESGKYAGWEDQRVCVGVDFRYNIGDGKTDDADENGHGTLVLESDVWFNWLDDEGEPKQKSLTLCQELFLSHILTQSLRHESAKVHYGNLPSVSNGKDFVRAVMNALLDDLLCACIRVTLFVKDGRLGMRVAMGNHVAEVSEK